MTYEPSRSASAGAAEPFPIDSGGRSRHPQAHAGANAWWVMFVALIPIPLLSVLLWVALSGVALMQNRTRGALARANSRNGLNWALTYLLVYVVVLVLSVAAVLLIDTTFATIALVGIPCTLLTGALTIVAIVHAIRGGLTAGRSEVYRAVGSIPFVRDVAVPAA